MPVFAALKSRLPKKRWQRALLYAASTFFILLAADMSLTAYWRRITISPEITYITAPLFPDGTPDYVTWLDQQAAAEATPENNAAYPALRAIGSLTAAAGFPDLESRMLARLGLPPVSIPRQLISYSEWASAPTAPSTSAMQTQSATPADQYYDEQNNMYRVPWTDAQHPNLARWLDSQATVLALAHEAAARSHYYMPALPRVAVPRPGQISGVLLPSLQGVRSLDRMLLADALRHIGDADKSPSIRSLTDAMKIGATLSRNHIVIYHLVGLLAMRESCEAVIAARDRLRPADARALLMALNAVPYISALDLSGERCYLLDLCAFEAQAGFAHSPRGPEGDAKLAPVLALVVPIHFNAAMRDINSIFDQLGQAQKIPSFQKRRVAVQAAESPLSQGSFSLIFRSVHALSPKMFSDLCGHDEEIRVRFQLTRLALALAIYHGDKGSYPATLESLAGPNAILDQIPLDGFTDRPFIYRPSTSGYTLYSVGSDLHDDNADPAKDLVIQHP